MAKREAWDMGDYGKVLIPLSVVLKEYIICHFFLERDNTLIGIFISLLDTLGPLLEIEWWVQLTCSWLLLVSFSL